MSWDFPAGPPAGSGPYGSGPYYEYPPGYGYPFASGPSMPLVAAAPGRGSGWQNDAAPQSTPLPLREAIKQLPRQYWKVLTRPGAATFAAEMGKAEWGIIWVQVLGYAALSAIFSLLAWLALVAFEWFLFSPFTASSPDGGGFPLASFLLVPGVIIGVCLFLGVFIASIGGFFFNQGIIYLLARAFGGQGSFTTQLYTTLLFQMPIGLVSGILALIPYLGGLAGSAAGIYGLVLQIFALMPVHRLSGGKASAVVLIPVAVAFLLIIGFYILLLVFLFSTLHTVGPSD